MIRPTVRRPARRPRRAVLAVATALLATRVVAGVDPASVASAQAATWRPAAFRPLAPCRLYDSRDGGQRIGGHSPVVVPTTEAQREIWLANTRSSKASAEP